MPVLPLCKGLFTQSTPVTLEMGLEETFKSLFLMEDLIILRKNIWAIMVFISINITVQLREDLLVLHIRNPLPSTTKVMGLAETLTF